MMRKFKERLARMNMPQELVLGWPRSVLIGNEQLVVEQHRGVYVCTDREIIVKTACGLMVISGEGLSLARYQADELTVLGRIERVGYRAVEEKR